MSLPGWPANAMMDVGWWRVETTTPPAIEPATVAEAKAWARVEYPDEDSLVADLIQACRERIEADLGRALITQTKTVSFLGFPTSGGYFNPLIRSMGPNPFWLPSGQGVIELPYPPLQSVSSIKYLDPSNGALTTVDPGQYLVGTGTPGRVQPTYGAVWPLSRPVIDSVRIEYVCGYGSTVASIPASTRIALRMLFAASFENREAFMQGGELTVTPAYERLLAVESTGLYY